ncbi:hypothetical protein IWX50DRAFT_638532 [Phyllosticta citricarpa]
MVGPVAPSGGNSGGRKRAAESPAQRGARPAKKKVADKSTSNGKASSKANAGEVRGSEQQQRDRPRTIITHLKDVPQPLRETLKTLTNFKKGAKAPSPDLAHVFHGQQSDSELYRLFTQAFICYDVSAYDGDKTDFYLRLLGHAYTHYLFRHIADQAIENCEDLEEEAGLVLHENIRKIFETPLPCCPAEQPPESNDEETG